MLRRVDEHLFPTGLLTRRQWLRVSSMAGLGGLAATKVASASERSNLPSTGFGRAKSVVLVFASGGQSQIDMWEPKPNAPLDVRGACGPTSTAHPGVHVSDHIAPMAGVAGGLTRTRA